MSISKPPISIVEQSCIRHVLALYGSSFFLIPFTAQSNVENSPPQTPKLPPNTGALALIAVRAPILRSPYGEFRNPLTPCHTAPPIPYGETCQKLGVVANARIKIGSANVSRNRAPKDSRWDTYSHTESASKIIQCHPRTRISCVIHDV